MPFFNLNNFASLPTGSATGRARPRSLPFDRHRSRHVGPQMGDWLPHFQVLRYDTRGHGASDSPEVFISVEQLGRRCSGPVGSPGIFKAAWCGYPWEGRSDNGFPFTHRIDLPSRAREHLASVREGRQLGIRMPARA